jgi:hypothetical protein
VSSPAPASTEKSGPRAPVPVRVAAVLTFLLGGPAAIITGNAGYLAAFTGDTEAVMSRAFESDSVGAFVLRFGLVVVFVAAAESLWKGRRWARNGVLTQAVIVLVGAVLGAVNGAHVVTWLPGGLVEIALVALLLVPASRAWFAAPAEENVLTTRTGVGG